MGFVCGKTHEASGTNEEMIATFAPVLGDAKRNPANDAPSISSNCKSSASANGKVCERCHQP
jgi:hypothetical protein